MQASGALVVHDSVDARGDRRLVREVEEHRGPGCYDGLLARLWPPSTRTRRRRRPAAVAAPSRGKRDGALRLPARRRKSAAHHHAPPVRDYDAIWCGPPARAATPTTRPRARAGFIRVLCLTASTLGRSWHLSWLLRTLYADAGGGPSQECGNCEEGSGDGSPTCRHCGSSSPSVVPAICPTRSDFLA